MIKLVIFGSRTIEPTIDEISKALTEFRLTQFTAADLLMWHEHRTNKPLIQIGCGMARGADLRGFAWAKHMRLPVVEFYADWTRHGKSAGPMRNEMMAAWATHALGFWDGTSGGTANMCANMVFLAKECKLVTKKPVQVNQEKRNEGDT